MSYHDRLPLMRTISDLRNSHLICYLTSTRPNVPAQMAEDQVRIFFDHLLKVPKRPVERLDIFLCSNGGNGVVPWRLISLFREFAKKIGVLIPYRAYSAATMLALGADEIVMHPFAEMGPIDPTVGNNFNPIDPLSKRRLGIGVEDVKAYVAFIKDTVGIRHEDELVRAIEILANQVHPLALGNVERFIAQNRMIARKILLTHMTEETGGREINDTIEILASKLYFHGHPINRREAREELKLKVASNVPAELEAAMWELYLDYETELLNNEAFDPMVAIHNQRLLGSSPAPADAPKAEAQQPIIPVGLSVQCANKLAMIESQSISSQFELTRRYTVVGTGPKLEPVVRPETIAQGWNTTTAPRSTAARRPPAGPGPGQRKKSARQQTLLDRARLS